MGEFHFQFLLAYIFLFIFLLSILLNILKYIKNLKYFNGGPICYRPNKLNLIYHNLIFYQILHIPENKDDFIFLFIYDVAGKMFYFYSKNNSSYSTKLEFFQTLIKDNILPLYGDNIKCYIGNVNILYQIILGKTTNFNS